MKGREEMVEDKLTYEDLKRAQAERLFPAITGTGDP